MKKDKASFRDASGFVFAHENKIFRAINACYEEEWQAAVQSGLLQNLQEQGLIIPSHEVEPVGLPAGFTPWKVLEVARIPYISYPHEWSFSQLRDAALLTLRIQRLALLSGMTLKDASAYNVQFIGSQPVFIDLLSFERLQEHSPWQGYKQFCTHFLAPLAIQQYIDRRCTALSSHWIDGIPIDIACALLPLRAYASAGIFLHLYLHSRMQKKYADARIAVNKIKDIQFTQQSQIDVVDSLEKAIVDRKIKNQTTEWGNYYTDTNYSAVAMRAKIDWLERMVERVRASGKKTLGIDLGANTGRFSTILKKCCETVVAADVDPAAVDCHYRELRQRRETAILPLVIDLTSPSPALGWACNERASFIARSKADIVLAFALCHHLRFTGGIPFTQLADFFRKITVPGGMVLVEFVPREDSQVQRLLAARDDIFAEYTEEQLVTALADAGFRQEEAFLLPESSRTLFAFRRGMRATP